MASKKERKLKITFAHADTDQKEAEENMLRIYEYLFFFNPNEERFYKEHSDDDTANT